MIFKKNSYSSSGSNKVAPHQQTKKDRNHSDIVSDEDIQSVLRKAGDISSSLESDTTRMNCWVSNAKLAIDVAQRSLEEAGKLAQNVQKVTQDTTEAANAVDRFGNASGEVVSAGDRQDPDILEKGSKMVRIVESAPTIDPNTTSLGQEECNKLQVRAQLVQALANESREQLSEVRSSLDRKTQRVASDMQNQAAKLSKELDSTAHSIEHKQSNSRNCSAEDILKGETPPQVDPKSLAKIDNVLSLQKVDSLDTEATQAPARSESSTVATNSVVPEETKVNAEDLLKNEGAVEADPASLDKIDGLPRRTRHSNEIAKVDESRPV